MSQSSYWCDSVELRDILSWYWVWAELLSMLSSHCFSKISFAINKLKEGYKRSESMLSFNAGDSALSSLYMIGFTYARPGDSATDCSDLPQGKDWAFYRPAEVIAEYESDE